MAEALQLGNGDCRVTLTTSGGAILSASCGGYELLRPAETPGLATRFHGAEACFPLVPFGNRLEHNRFTFEGHDHHLARNTEDALTLHGDGWLNPWQVVERTQEMATLAFSRRADWRSPYAYRAEQQLDVQEDGFTLRLTVRNEGERTLPFGLGLHPYFPLDEGTRLTFDARAVWTEGPQHLPGRPMPLSPPLDFSASSLVLDMFINNAFEGWNGEALIHRRDAPSIRLAVDPLFSWLMLYRPAGQAEFICLEPMSHRPNAHHAQSGGGLVALAPGEALSGSMTVRLVP